MPVAPAVVAFEGIGPAWLAAGAGPLGVDAGAVPRGTALDTALAGAAADGSARKGGAGLATDAPVLRWPHKVTTGLPSML